MCRGRLDADAFAALQALQHEHAPAEAGELTGAPPTLRRLK